MHADFELCYRAVRSKDPRFDGWFFTAVRTTGIYCRPSCPAITPKRENVSFHPTSASAQSAGYRACKRCRPDATPGSPEWNRRADAVGRAMRLIADGVVDREGVAGLARRLAYSARHLHRLLSAEVGAGPLALARAQRAQTARVLVETTTMAFGDVAFASGFESIRQFNDTIRQVFARSPTEMRQRRAAAPGSVSAFSSSPTSMAGDISLRLPFRAPLDAAGLLVYLGRRAVAGVEEVTEQTYRRTLRLPRGWGIVTLTPSGSSGSASASASAGGFVQCRLRLEHVRDLSAAVQRCRRLLDLDADPVAVDEQLSADDLLGLYVAKRPGRRSPGTVDGTEIVVRAVLGQQVSLATARGLAARLTVAWGEPLSEADGTLTHMFPSAATLADLDPATLPLPASRARSLIRVCRSMADGTLVVDAGADRDETERRLLEHPGIGPWTASYVVMRALGDPDVFMPSDLGVHHALRHLGVACDPASAARLAERWRPWRSYAMHHLWASLD